MWLLTWSLLAFGAEPEPADPSPRAWEASGDDLGTWFPEVPARSWVRFVALRGERVAEGEHASTLAGVRCEVHRSADGSLLLGVGIAPEARPGEGSCALRREDGSARVVPLKVGPA